MHPRKKKANLKISYKAKSYEIDKGLYQIRKL